MNSRLYTVQQIAGELGIKRTAVYGYGVPGYLREQRQRSQAGVVDDRLA